MPHIKPITLVITTIFIAALCYANWPSSWLSDTKPSNVDKIVVNKSVRQLSLLSNGKVIKTYKISLGFTPIGNKQIEGDGKTPEGAYTIDSKNPNSVAHLSLHISYPTAEQIRLSQAAGQNPGGMIMIHGLMNGFGWIGRFHRLVDWTKGCVAVTNQEIEEIYNATPVGTPIVIEP